MLSALSMHTFVVAATITAIASAAPAVFQSSVQDTQIITNNGLTYLYLRDTRRDITGLPLSFQDRETILNDVKSLFDIYVHRDLKIEDYGKQYPNIDPISRVAALIAYNNNTTNTTTDAADLSFHYALSDIFLSLRDFHTNYILPAPHLCFQFTTGIQFELVDDLNSSSTKVIVSDFAASPEILQLIQLDINLLDTVNIGDEMLLVNNETFQEYFEKNQWRTGGAGESGGQRSALTSLEAFSGMLYRKPEEDSIKFTIQSSTGQINVVEVPWIAIRDDDCFLTAQSALQNWGNENPSSSGSSTKNPLLNDDSIISNTQDELPASLAKSDTKTKLPSNVLNIGGGMVGNTIPSQLLQNKARSPHLDSVLQTFVRDATVDFDLHQTEISSISWGIYKPNTRNLGIIIISDFEPSISDPDAVTLLVRSLLTTRLANTKAIVIDVRDNPGGYITIADYLPQLFGTSVVPVSARLLVNQINTNIFTGGNYPNDSFSMTYLSTPPGERYTHPIPFDTADESYQYGQAYFKSVGVLTNGNCFSACDMFSANMQDNGIAVVFGEDKSTGAGGANVVDLYNFLLQVDTNPSDFTPLPDFFLSPYNQYLRVAWRQVLREGLPQYQDKQIEDKGVESDVIVRPLISDFVDGVRSYKSQWDRIQSYLIDLNNQTGKSYLFFVSEPFLRDGAVDYPVLFESLVSGFAKITLLETTPVDGTGEVNSTVIGTTIVPNTAFKKKIALNITSTNPYTKKRLARFEIRGENRKGDLLLRTIRHVRFIPPDSSMFSLNADHGSLVWDFNGADPYFAIFNYALTTKDYDGWRVVSNPPALRVGNGISYVKNLNTRASFFLNVQKPGTAKGTNTIRVRAKGALNSEANFDYFIIGYEPRSNGTNEILYSNSGQEILDIDLSFDNPGGIVEIFFLFQSDPSVTYSGANLTSIEISII